MPLRSLPKRSDSGKVPNQSLNQPVIPIMIDTRNEVPSPTAARGSRRPGSRSSRRKAPTRSVHALKIDRVFSTASVHPFDQIEWETRNAEITDDSGKVIFR